jgi:hypothetical protein
LRETITQGVLAEFASVKHLGCPGRASTDRLAFASAMLDLRPLGSRVGEMTSRLTNSMARQSPRPSDVIVVRRTLHFERCGGCRVRHDLFGASGEHRLSNHSILMFSRSLAASSATRMFMTSGRRSCAACCRLRTLPISLSHGMSDSLDPVRKTITQRQRSCSSSGNVQSSATASSNNLVMVLSIPQSALATISGHVHVTMGIPQGRSRDAAA